MTVAAPRSVPTTSALLATGVTMVLWATAFVAIRGIGDEFSPGAMAFGRLLAGTAALGVIALLTGWLPGPRRQSARVRRPSGRALALIAIYGVAWFGGYTVALNAAEVHVDAGTAAVLVNIGPLLIAAYAGAFLGEGFPRNLAIGMGVAFVGVVVIGASTFTGKINLLGVLLGLAAAALYAVGVLVQKQALGLVNPMTATFFGCLIGCVACAVFAPAFFSELGRASGGAIWAVIYLGVFPTAIAFSTWAYALSGTPAGVLSASSYVVPALAFALGWLLLGEVPAWLTVLGGVLSLVGVVITRLPSRRRSRASGG
ncbi:EamA family transporter [Nakamurella aerolata]|uniref:DMT family transporter n=1 Tax=Nakamurella aerolata TaxID=1656892 RepID=A0A849AA27_9ACTN|nr:DMT family transporter [Nakamurella aerolata]